VLLYRYSPKPGPGSKTKARHVPWDDHRQDFLDTKNPGFFGPTRGMLRSSTVVAIALVRCEDHVWFEDQWMVASLCDE
jgi:hypothetical protein